LGKYEEAIDCFDKALKINPRYAVAWTVKEYTFYKLRNYEGALKCYDKVLKLSLRSLRDVAAWYNTLILRPRFKLNLNGQRLLKCDVI